MKRRVVITGMGIVCSIGKNIEDFWSNCLAEKSVVKPIPVNWLDYAEYKSQYWSPLPEIDFSLYNLTTIEQKNNDKISLMALASTIQALDSAKLKYELKNSKDNTYIIPSIENNRTGVFIGSAIGGINSETLAHSYHILSQHKKNLRQVISTVENNIDENTIRILKRIDSQMILPRRFNPHTVSMIMPNAPAAKISIKFGLTGASNTYCTACASGTTAMGNGYRAVESNLVDIAITGGVDYLYDEYGTIFYGFDVLNALATGDNGLSINRPFDETRTGFLFSEGGGAVLILEELEHARRRGATILAEVINYSETCDAHSIIAIEKKGISIRRMLHDCLMNSNLEPKQINYINAHGTGTILNDEIETKIIEDIFGKEVLVNSTKSLIGHTLGAAGAIEAIVTVLSICNKKTHTCKNLNNQIRQLNFVKEVEDHPIDVAITQSFGFGGHNAALVLKAAPLS